MRRLLCFFILLPFLATGQNPLHESHYVDSLRAITQQKQLGDSSRALANYSLSGYFSQFDNKKAKAYLKAANQLARHYPYLLAGEPFYEALMLPEDDLSSLELYKKADSLLAKFRTPEASLFRSKIWLNYASVLQFQDKQKEMVNTIISKAIPLAKKGENKTLLAYMYSDLAIALSNIDRFEEAKTYFMLAIEGLKNTKNSSSRIAAVYVNAASAYTHLGDFKQAKQMLDEAHIRLNPSPKSLTWPDYYAVESFYYNRTSNEQAALESADKGLILARELKLDYLLQSLLLEKLESFKKLKNNRAAEEIFSTLLTDPTFLALTNARKDAYRSMAEIYADGQQFSKAYHWMHRYSDMSDSIANSNLNQEIAEMELRYRNQENLHHISTLKSQKAKVEFQSKNNRLMIGLLVVLVLFFLLLLFLLMLNYQKNRRLALQEKISYQQQLKELAQQKQLQVSSALIEGEERERKRMASDLHDGLGSMLAGIKLHLSALFEQNISASSQATEQAIVDQLDSSLTELRRIAKNMMPETLIKFGLERALSDLCLSANHAYLKVEFQAFGMDEVLPEKTQIMIYRIIQEILTNAIKHADASAIFIQCSQSDHLFLITAEDNGKGFSTDPEHQQPGMGLDSIQTRVEYLKGKMDLNSICNEGTIINIELDV